MKINLLNLPVFYINLKKDKQKSIETVEVLKSLGFTNINRFDAILGETKKEGCAKSHQALLKELDIDGPFIVFEDDIESNGSFNPVIEVPDDADAVYLGISAYSLDNGITGQSLVADKIDDNLYRIYNMLAAHAILYLNKDYYKFLAKAIQAMINADRNQDNARAETMKYFNVYAFRHPFFYQGDKHKPVTRFDLETAKPAPYGKVVPKSLRTNKKLKNSYYLDQRFTDKNPPRIDIIILSWKRKNNINKLLNMLGEQTYKNFSVHISNGNPPFQKSLRHVASVFSNNYGIKATVRNDGNDLLAFRRLLVAKELAEAGSDIILYIDDDISIPRNYVEMCLSQYEEKTYGSGFAYKLYNGGRNYYKDRERIWEAEQRPYYCGTGISIIDAKIFLEEGLTDLKTVPKGAIDTEDLWLSYYADHILKWKLKYVDMPGAVVGGGDSVALYKQIQKQEYTKANFLQDLVKMGWKIPKNKY